MAYIVCTSNLDIVSFLFVPALYSTLKLEIFPFTCIYIVRCYEAIFIFQHMYCVLCALVIGTDAPFLCFCTKFDACAPVTTRHKVNQCAHSFLVELAIGGATTAEKVPA